MNLDERFKGRPHRAALRRIARPPRLPRDAHCTLRCRHRRRRQQRQHCPLLRRHSRPHRCHRVPRGRGRKLHGAGQEGQEVILCYLSKTWCNRNICECVNSKLHPLQVIYNFSNNVLNSTSIFSAVSLRAGPFSPYSTRHVGQLVVQDALHGRHNQWSFSQE